MYSANRASEQGVPAVTEKSAAEPAKQHQDLSPELKEVMHLLKVMENGQGTKGS